MSVDLLQDLLGKARTAGADMADCVLVSSTALSVQRRLGRTEQLERSESLDLGLRVFVGGRQAIVSSTTVDAAGFGRLAERAVAMARIVPEDPHAGLADEMQPPSYPPLDMEDAQEPSVEALVARASTAEEAALAVAGITNSEGAEAGVWHADRGGAGDVSAGFSGVLCADQPLGCRRRRWPVAARTCSGTTTIPTAVHLADLSRTRLTLGRSAADAGAWRG